MVGRRISHYTVLEKLGSGGMGEVWKAEDTQLRRPVALKFLPREKLGEEEVKARMLREAQAAAALDHPNICQVYGIHQEQGETFIAMAYIEGPSLADKIRERPLPLDQALNITAQIAEGLQEAHENGVIHRDIKPQNIMLTAKGQVKITDFGLASLAGRSKLTKSGTTLGTPAYMAPEQLEARKVDRRADIWALGCVLYEMLTQRTPFEAEYEQDIAYSILNQAPEPLTALRRGLPTKLDDLVAKALQKEESDRYQHVDEMLVDLRNIDRSAPRGVGRNSPKLSGTRRDWIFAAGAVVVGVLLASLAWYGASRFRPEPTAASRAQPLTTLPGSEQTPSFSPDGTQVAFAWTETTGSVGVYVQVIGEGDPLPIAATSRREFSPAWSPGGRRVAFLREHSSGERADIVTVPALGGAETKLGEAVLPFRGAAQTRPPYLAWTPDGDWIIYVDKPADEGNFSLFAVSPTTREQVRLTTAPPGSMGDTGPSVSPDGSTLVFARFVATGVSDLYLLDLNDALAAPAEPERLTFENELTFSPTWLSDTDIAFTRRYSLYQVSKASRQESGIILGESHLRNEEVTYSRASNRLAYSVRTGDSNIRMVALSEPGRPSGEPQFVSQSTRLDVDPGVSHDGLLLAFRSDRTGSPEIWVSGIEGRGSIRLTNLNGPQTESPVWSPDDKQLAFDSRTGGTSTIYIIDAGGGVPLRLCEGERPAWSPDGKWIYFTTNRSGRFDIWRIPVEGGDAEQITTGGGIRPRFSPDGRHMYFARIYQRGPLMHAPPDGGPETEVVPSLLDAASFAVGDKGIYFVPESNDAIRFLDFGSGEVREVLSLDRPYAWGMDLTADGRTLFWSETTIDNSDLVYIEDFQSPTVLGTTVFEPN